MKATHYPAEALTSTPTDGAKMWTVTAANAMLTYFEIEPNQHFAPQAHERDQITYMLEGCLYFEFEDGRVTVQAGEVITVPAHTPHALTTQEQGARGVDAWSART